MTQELSGQSGQRERRRRRDPEVRVWDRLVRASHWTLAFCFAVLYLDYKRFPLHPYAGYLLIIVLLVRFYWGLKGRGAARFSVFLFGPREIWRYFRDAMTGHAAYYVSHNPMGAAMVFSLWTGLFVNGILGLLAYSASQQLGPFGALISADWEDALIEWHSLLGHGLAILVVGHLCGVVWAAWLHRENYIVAMFTGRRRIPRAVPLPPGVTLPEEVAPRELGWWGKRWQAVLTWLTYRAPLAGSFALMGLMLSLVLLARPWLRVLNKLVPAY